MFRFLSGHMIYFLLSKYQGVECLLHLVGVQETAKLFSTVFLPFYKNTSICGFYAGHVLGRHFGRIVEIAGGCVLIFLAVKWLL